MDKSNLIILLLVFALLGTLTCERIKTATGPDNNRLLENYPTTIAPLGEDDLQNLKQKVNAMFPNLNHANHDTWGVSFIELRKKNFKGNEQYTPESALQLARDFIFKYKIFFGVQSIADLDSFQYNHITVNDWKINFYQYKSEYLVSNTTIKINIDSQGIYFFSGKFYTGIITPAIINYKPNQVEKILIGYKYSYYCWSYHELFVEQSLIHDPSRLFIYPDYIRENENIELRLVWHIPIGSKDDPLFYAYIDAVTYELVAFGQRFIC